MLLTGTHPRTLDDKKRLSLPKKVRDQVGVAQQLFAAPGPDQTLWLYTREELERLSSKLDEPPATDAEARVCRRLVFAQIEEVDLDKSSRILLPDRLLEFAGLEHEVVLLGVRDHMELWSAKRWQSYLGKHAPKFDKVAEEAFRTK